VSKCSSIWPSLLSAPHGNRCAHQWCCIGHTTRHTGQSWQPPRDLPGGPPTLVLTGPCDAQPGRSEETRCIRRGTAISDYMLTWGRRGHSLGMRLQTHGTTPRSLWQFLLKVQVGPMRRRRPFCPGRADAKCRRSPTHESTHQRRACCPPCSDDGRRLASQPAGRPARPPARLPASRPPARRPAGLPARRPARWPTGRSLVRSASPQQRDSQPTSKSASQ
jgi:hypothetical protein